MSEKVDAIPEIQSEIKQCMRCGHWFGTKPVHGPRRRLCARCGYRQFYVDAQSRSYRNVSEAPVNFRQPFRPWSDAGDAYLNIGAVYPIAIASSCGTAACALAGCAGAHDSGLDLSLGAFVTGPYRVSVRLRY